jgi:hypothetical protein
MKREELEYCGLYSQAKEELNEVNKNEELEYCGLYSQAKEKLDKIDKNILVRTYRTEEDKHIENTHCDIVVKRLSI